ncbi:ABC transporter ATP-binding protein [Dermabacteraceae bacterium TAE3-ERU5]|nr:ABC transporter ATP-binding protein [Dermabacteraceae bacterium TAE3-ERU5]
MVEVAALRDVSVRRSGKFLVRGINWTLNEGERWVVLGPNGAGKSTLVSLLAGRLHPSSGEVALLEEKLGQQDVFELRPLIGIASQELAQALPADERVLDVVMTASYGVTGRWREEYEGDDEERAMQLLRAFDVQHLAERTYGTLSSGERKRVLSARAMMTDPELLLLDEPASGLDLGGREELVRSLGTLAEDPATPVTVLVTHHLEEIPPAYTHALLLRDGEIVSAGPISEALTSSTLTAAFGLPLVVNREEGRWFARALSAR